jgi:hypothetical protein
MVRRRPEAYRGEPLSLGLMDDEEALTSALNQYLGGGIVCFTERLAEIDEDRLLLLRHCSPSIGAAALPLDAMDGVRFPSVFLTCVAPRCAALGPWVTLAFVNWTDTPRAFRLPVADALRGHLPGAWGGDREDLPDLLVTSFRHGDTQRQRPGQELSTRPVPPHGCEVLKLQPVRSGLPCLLHGDGHFSMGGTELLAWQPTEKGVALVVDWPWPCSLRLTVGWSPEKGTREEVQVEVPACSRKHTVSVRLA